MPSQVEIADALGLTRQRVSVLVKQGMPIDSVEAAVAWRQAQEDARRRLAPKSVAPDSLDDGTLAGTITEHRRLVSQAQSVWRQAMETGDTNQGKFQTAYNQSLRTLINLEEEQERRAILARDFISAKEAAEAMRRLAGDVVNRLDKLALDVAEQVNPENPAKAVKALEAWVRRVKADLSEHGEA